VIREYPQTTPHGEIKQIFDDVFIVTGSVVMAPGIQLSRNMIIVREDTSLTLISTVRLDDKGLRALETLGDVKDVVKLGAYHLGDNNGIDDPFYVDKYNAKLWALPDMKHLQGLSTTNLLTPEGELPFKDAVLFSYETSKKPEGLILINRAGGILISCDSLQNWLEPDEYFSDLAASVMGKAGFFRTANIGPEWLRACEPKAPDFSRVLELEFNHLLPSHGKPIIATAKREFAATFKKFLKL